MGHYISVEDIKPHYMKVLFFKNSQFWPVLIKIRETWVKLLHSILDSIASKNNYYLKLRKK